MGYRDRTLRLSVSQNVTAAADSLYYVDTGITNPKWNRGVAPVAVIINVETVNTAGTGFTITVVHKATEPTINDANLIAVVFLAAHLTAGKQVVIPFPIGITLLQMIRIYYSRTGGSEDYVFSAYLTPTLPPI
jgi:hypothetical protein